MPPEAEKVLQPEIVSIAIRESDELKSAGHDLAKRAEALQVKNDLDLRSAVDLQREMSVWIKNAKAYYADDISSANKLHKNLTGKRSFLVALVAPAFEAMSKRVGNYRHTKEQERLKKERLAQEEADRKLKRDQDKMLDKAEKAEEKGDTEKADSIVEQAQTHYVPPKPVATAPAPPGSVLRYETVVTVVDKSKVPDTWKIVEVNRLKAAYNAQKYDLVVPGVKFERVPRGGFRG